MLFTIDFPSITRGPYWSSIIASVKISAILLMSCGVSGYPTGVAGVLFSGFHSSSASKNASCGREIVAGGREPVFSTLFQSRGFPKAILLFPVSR